MHIANPLYDAAFKYLLEDDASAKVLLSALIDAPIVSIAPLARAHVAARKTRSFTVYNQDFSARVRTREGRFKQVILEVQKAKTGTDIMRFHRSLEAQHSSKALVTQTETGDPYPLPIMSVYFLGHKLKHLNCSVVRVGRQCLDAVTSSPLYAAHPGERRHDRRQCCNAVTSSPLNNPEEEFIERLTHDSLVVQVSLLKAPYRGELERLLSIFDQHRVRENGHVLVVDEHTVPREGRVLLRRLNRAVMEPEVREKMQAEDDYLAPLAALQRKVEDQQELLEEKDKALKQKEKLAQQQEKALKGRGRP